MEWLGDLFMGSSIAHSIMLLAITIAIGIVLGKIKIANISLGITWILFVGIAFSHFGLRIDSEMLHFVKELGLILFVYSIGLQVGPGFFSSLRKGGLKLNMLALTIVLLGGVTTYVIHLVTGTSLSTMVGILSGAVTNTPGLGAAQQTYNEIHGVGDPTIALGYAVAYPLGVVGIILTTLFVRFICKVKLDEESRRVALESPRTAVQQISMTISNAEVVGRTIKDVLSKHKISLVISRIKRADGNIEIATNDTVLYPNDVIRIITDNANVELLKDLFGTPCEMNDKDWKTDDNNLVSRRIIVTKPELNGRKIGDLEIRSLYGVNVTRINRAGIDLVASFNLQLQMGDRITVVGRKENVEKVADMLGNSMKRLDHPNLIPIFFGIFLGIIVGSIPLVFPGIPQPVKLGLAGGPLIVAILIGRYGPYYRMVTFTTTSANMMIREIGISLFLAAVGLDAGSGFIETVMKDGYVWIMYGFLITVLPLLIVGLIGRLIFKLDYFTLMGLMAGSTTDPPALAFANSVSDNDMPSVAYATVYPLTMFLRVLTAQLLIIFSI